MDDHKLFVPFGRKVDKKAPLMKWADVAVRRTLENAGFISYRNEGLSWYRVVNHEILHTVYIYNTMSMTPMIPQIGYGIHPLFIKAPIPQKISITGWSDNEVMSTIFLNTPMKQLPDNPYIMCPSTPLLGGEKLIDDLLPRFEGMDHVEDVYSFHKAEHFRRISVLRQGGFGADAMTSDGFVDMVIYMEDEEMFPKCLRDLSNKDFGTKSAKSRRAAQRMTMESGSLEEYRTTLQARKKRFINTLQKELGLEK